MSARSELLTSKKQALSTEITEQDSTQIQVYFRHKIVSLVREIEEKLKKHNALPDAEDKKSTKVKKSAAPKVTDVSIEVLVLVLAIPFRPSWRKRSGRASRERFPPRATTNSATSSTLRRK